MVKFQCAVLLLGVFFVVGCAKAGPKWHFQEDFSGPGTTGEGPATTTSYLSNDHSYAIISVMQGPHYRLLCQYALESYAVFHKCPIRYGKNLEYCAHTDKSGERTLVLKVNVSDTTTWITVGSKAPHDDDFLVNSFARSVGMKLDLGSLQSRAGRNHGAITEIHRQFMKLPEKWIELSNALGAPPTMYVNTMMMEGTQDFLDIEHLGKSAESRESKPFVRYGSLVIPLKGSLMDFDIKLKSTKFDGEYKTEVEGFMKNVKPTTFEALSKAAPPGAN